MRAVIAVAAIGGGCATPLPPWACVTVSAMPDGPALAAWNVRAGDEIRIRYVHSVTLSPVEERYRVAAGMLEQTEIRFEEHGPGLPTEADASPGASWSHEGGQFVVRLDRRFEGIVARVDPGQAPRLDIASRTVDLAQWGRRALRLSATAGRCPG